MIFLNSLIMGTTITISSYSWFSMWMGLEINLLSIIPLFSHKKNMFSSESSLKYFVTQAMASMILLMAVILLLLTNEFINSQMNFYFLMMLNSALLIKLGAAPFHFWFPEVMEGLSWMNCLILLTWQKIAPMVILMNNSMNKKFFTVIIILCLMVSVISALNQISLRKIMAFSSINHMSWMLVTMMISHSVWFLYFMIYSLMNISMVMIFYFTNSFYISQLNNIMNNNKMVKFSFMLNLWSLGGLPPLIGFLPKWIVISWMVKNEMYFLNFILIITTLVMLYIYIRISFSGVLLSYSEFKINVPKMSTMKFNILNFITISSLISCTLSFNFF